MTQLIGLVGRAGSGKGTAAKIIQGYTMDSKMTSKWKVVKFAGKLRKVASILTGVPVHKWEDREFKASTMGSKWATRMGDDAYYMTAREFLQRLGTNGIRDNVHPDVWINAIFADWKPDSHWIIDDCRFMNEYQAIKSRGGLVIYLERETGTEDLHISETEMQSFQHLCDAQIPNNGGIQDLTYLLRYFLIQHNIIPS